ncbi:MAG: isochorismatase family cysteine hydrolase [Candidatus Thorarchaeota archaeon]
MRAGGVTALIVVDMLNDFVRPSGRLPVNGAESLLPVQRRLLEVARELGYPIVYLADNHLPDDPEFTKWPPHAIVGTEGSQVVSEIAPQQSDRVIPKRRYSGFFGTDLDLTLRENGVSRIMLMGVLTDICVMYTSADASALGYEVIVVSDATMSTDDENHRFALQHMKYVHGASVITAEEAVGVLEQGCACPG